MFPFKFVGGLYESGSVATESGATPSSVPRHSRAMAHCGPRAPSLVLTASEISHVAVNRHGGATFFPGSRTRLFTTVGGYRSGRI